LASLVRIADALGDSLAELGAALDDRRKRPKGAEHFVGRRARRWAGAVAR
jgi:hypothetical protein